MEEIRRKVAAILQELRLPDGWEESQRLVDDRILDSFSLITLISDLNQAFDVAVTADKIIPENFNSVDDLARMVSELLDED